jgi:hypothetical protein
MQLPYANDNRFRYPSLRTRPAQIMPWDDAIRRRAFLRKMLAPRKQSQCGAGRAGAGRARTGVIMLHQDTGAMIFFLAQPGDFRPGNHQTNQ